MVPLGRTGTIAVLRQIWIVTRLRDQNTVRMNFTKNIGMLLLAIYLILVGIIGIFAVSLGAAAMVLPILALVAGILILIGK